MNTITEEAESGIAAERLAGNIVKEEFFKGQMSVAMQITHARSQIAHSAKVEGE